MNRRCLAGSADELRRHVERLAALGERSVRRPAALEAAAGYIATTWQKLGYTVRRQSYLVGDTRCQNLEITMGGTQRSEEIILAGAHYDTVEGSPGADDNASGVAALLEIARLLQDLRPVRTLRLVAFVNEEPPFFFYGDMGSKVYARAARRRGDDIRVMLSLEMLGCYSNEPGSQRYPPPLGLFYPDRGNFIGFVSNLRSCRALRRVITTFRRHSDFPSESLVSPAFVPGVAWSDQLSFWREGYRAVMVKDTAFYRYPWYHTPFDTPERLCYPEMAEVVKGLAGALATLAS